MDQATFGHAAGAFVRDLRLEDGPATPGHYNDTTLALGYLGDVVMTTTTPTPGTPPFMGSHRIEVTGQGHTEFCAGNPPAYCQYMFGLPPFSPIP